MNAFFSFGRTFFWAFISCLRFPHGIVQSFHGLYCYSFPFPDEQMWERKTSKGHSQELWRWKDSNDGTKRRWADMEVPSESFHRSSWDSRTCYPRRAFNQELTDDAGDWSGSCLLSHSITGPITIMSFSFKDGAVIDNEKEEHWPTTSRLFSLKEKVCGREVETVGQGLSFSSYPSRTCPPPSRLTNNVKEQSLEVDG